MSAESSEPLVPTLAWSPVGSPAEALPGEPLLPPRYEDRGLIGAGGMGEVRRVWDRVLERALAMKVLRWDAHDDPEAARRFLREARTTAGLQHPGVISVHDQGVLPDGRPWITLDEVRGQTLDQRFAAAHAEDRDQLLELVQILHAVCKTVAFAHGRGVVHRDLKPLNVMIGEHGEVLVLDWGLAAGVGLEPDEPVMGTPSYLAPERVQGEPEVDPRQDVYALGCMLYELLAGRRPYVGLAADVLERLAREAPPPLGRNADGAGGREVPEELRQLCEQAMARDPARRFPDAEPLARGLFDWLDQSRRRAQAEEIVHQSDALLPGVSALRAEAEALRSRAAELLSACRPQDPEELKRPAWALEDRAEALEREATLLEEERLAALHSALRRVEDLPSAHARLADHYRVAIDRAEARHRPDEALRAEAWLRRHDRGQHAAFLGGGSALTLVTEPPGAEVEVRWYAPEGRRLVLGPPEKIGNTPILSRALRHGSVVLEVRLEGYEPLRVPVLLPRGEPWDGRGPGEREPHVYRLLPAGSLGSDEVYLPAGWLLSGGDPEATDGLPRARIWLDDLVFRRFPVTNAEYLAFLDALLAEGRGDEAAALLPREAGQGEDERPLYTLGSDGRYALRVDGEGERWRLDWPVTMVSWRCASAYARWLAAREGLPWRLPHDLEWERAARGADGRVFPWGDHADPTWARMVNSLEGRPQRASVHDHPLDASPFGVRGLGGNVRDWCANAYQRLGPERVEGRPRLISAEDLDDSPRLIRGGCWASPARLCRVAGRFADRPEHRNSVLGFRLVRELTWR